jgi:uncharacterized membrane protein YczE
VHRHQLLYQRKYLRIDLERGPARSGTSMKIKALNFLSVKGVPVLFWSSPKALTLKPPFISMVFLVVGLTLFGIGEALLIAAGAGVSPWTVFAQGITNVTGWSIGFATFVISISVLICWVPLKQTPGIGTILNAVIIALVLEFLLPFLPRFENPMLQLGEAVIGVLVTGFGGALYLISNLGPGPRDGLMTGLQRVTNAPIAWVRSGLEITVIVLGWSLGGTVGIGTFLFALGIGPAVAASMYGLNAVSNVCSFRFKFGD